MNNHRLSFLLPFLFFSLSVNANGLHDDQVLSWRYSLQHPQESESIARSGEAKSTASITSSTDGGLAHLNQLRRAASMIALAGNTLLDQAAFNHSNYHILNNASGHGELNATPGFTGVSPTDRGAYMGYLSSVSENISVGSTDVFDSIDQLFSAIYHRFGFLSFNHSEIGLGTSSSEAYTYSTSFVYDMGNDEINTLCEGESYTGSGGYYYRVCNDDTFRIETGLYEATLDLAKAANPALVVWPYENQTDILPAFFEESPDPLPDCSVSGYPVSVQFNEYYSGTIAMQSFRLYDSDSNEIVNTRLLTAASDPNGRFSAYEFALFPLERLDWNSSYRAEIMYTEDGMQKSRVWTFRTRATPFPYYQVESNNQTLQVVSGKSYVIYIPPTDCNDSFNGYGYSFSGLTVDSIGFNDLNSIYVQVSGGNGKTITVNLNNGINFTLQISATDSALPITVTPAKEEGAMVDFGSPYGVWLYDSENWIQLHNALSEQISASDLDANGQRDIVIDFGSTYGLWSFMNNNQWLQLHAISPEEFITGDIDANGKDDVIVDFGSAYGLWAYMNNSSWTQLHSVSPESLVMADMDNNGKDEVIIDFGASYGIWMYQNNNNWQQLHAVSSNHLASGDIDANNQDDIIIDFGATHGIWIYFNNSTWLQLHNSSSTHLVTGDLDANGSDDLVIDFGSQLGIWIWMNNSNWQQIHTISAEQMETRYLDSNNKKDVLIDFGSQYGLWVWKNNTAWEQLHVLSPEVMGR